MAKRAQYNDGTGEAKYTAGTSKQQVYDTNAILADCSYCNAPCGYCSGEQPKYIDVTFSGISEYAGCCQTGFGSFKVNNSIVSSITGQTFRLSHASDCFYNTFPVPSGSIYNHSGTANCTNPIPTNINVSSVTVFFEYTSATTFRIIVSHLISPGWWVYSFWKTGETFSSGDCFDIDNKVVTNGTTACTEPVYAIGTGGTATITLPPSGL